MEEAKRKVNDYLGFHTYLRLATVTSEGRPMVHTVAYVSEEAQVYFSTDLNSRKAKNIMANPAVAYAVDENYEDVFLIQGIQMEGRAEVVENSAELDRVKRLMQVKFPFLKNMPPNPDIAVFRIIPVVGYFLDNTVAFGHRDMFTY